MKAQMNFSKLFNLFIVLVLISVFTLQLVPTASAATPYLHYWHEMYAVGGELKGTFYVEGNIGSTVISYSEDALVCRDIHADVIGETMVIYGPDSFIECVYRPVGEMLKSATGYELKAEDFSEGRIFVSVDDLITAETDAEPQMIGWSNEGLSLEFASRAGRTSDFLRFTADTITSDSIGFYYDGDEHFKSSSNRSQCSSINVCNITHNNSTTTISNHTVTFGTFMVDTEAWENNLVTHFGSPENRIGFRASRVRFDPVCNATGCW